MITRTTDPETSHEAAASVDVTKSRDFVLSILRDFGPMADFEIEDQSRFEGHKWTGQRLRTARAQLVKQNLVVWDECWDKMPESGRRTRVWRATAS